MTPEQPTAPLTPVQGRLLGVLRRNPEPLEFPEAMVEALKAEATEAVAQLSARLGGVQLKVFKSFLSKVHGCEVRHLAPDDFEWSPATTAGTVAHKAIELSLNWPGEPAPSEAVDEAIARLVERGDNRALYLHGLSAGEHAELRSRAVDRTTKFIQDFPPLPATAQPVLESSVRWQPRGTIEFSGKVDLVVGRPSGRESRLLVVDFKSGSRSPMHRDDLRFYALLLTLRNEVPPRKLVTYYLDYADHDVEDVTEGVLRAALVRTLEGIERHIELTVEGREPMKRVGFGCRWCPVLDDCTEGAAHLRTLSGDD